jgi:hypothetical protein
MVYIQLNPRYIKNEEGNNFVILSKQEFDALIEELDELEDIYLYDTAKNNDSGERIPMMQVFETIEINRIKAQ